MGTSAPLLRALLTTDQTQRYVGLLCGLWSFIALVLTVVFYHPPPRINSQGLSRREVLVQIDYVGGFLSISGLLLFMMGLQWGGYQYEWTSAHVLAPLLIGVALMVSQSPSPFLTQANHRTPPP